MSHLCHKHRRLATYRTPAEAASVPARPSAVPTPVARLPGWPTTFAVTHRRNRVNRSRPHLLRRSRPVRAGVLRREIQPAQVPPEEAPEAEASPAALSRVPRARCSQPGAPHQRPDQGHSARAPRPRPACRHQAKIRLDRPGRFRGRHRNPQRKRILPPPVQAVSRSLVSRQRRLRPRRRER